jgi:hypothetical protein
LPAYHPHKLSALGSFSEKNLNSDDHFERPFLFMVMKGKQSHENLMKITKTKSKAAKKAVRIKDLETKRDPRAGGDPNQKPRGGGSSPDGVFQNHNETFLRD